MPRSIIVLLAVAALGGCPESSETPDANWPDLRFDVVAPADLGPEAPPDMTVDCPALDLGDAGALGWQVVHVAQNPLREIACAKGHLFVAGDKGTLLHREPQSSLCSGFASVKVPTTSDLLTVHFTDLSYGVIAGHDHQIWESRDGGKTWAVAPQCGDVKFSSFYDLHVHSLTQGFGAGVAEAGGGAYKIFAGKTWICPNETYANQTFLGTFSLNTSAWLVGDTQGRIYYTPDQAYTWFSSAVTSAKPLWAVSFTPSGTGIAVGEEGVIMRSEDGLAWIEVMTLGNDNLYEVFFWDDNVGWIVGDSGTVMRTDDGGKTWTYQPVPTTERLEGVCFTSATDGWIVGAGGSILATTSGGT